MAYVARYVADIKRRAARSLHRACTREQYVRRKVGTTCPSSAYLTSCQEVGGTAAGTRVSSLRGMLRAIEMSSAVVAIRARLVLQ